MQFDIESTMQENIRLKKALQMSRFQNERLQKQLKELQELYNEEQSKNTSLKAQYIELNRKYQQSYTESIKDNNSLISQIQELKKIIDQKQRDMENLQIKLIPTLDQDMLRVKLITQMEGPYQQAVQRKEKQIQRLKQKVIELQRNLQITSLSLKSKISEYKKQNHQIKARYDQENNRLMQELNLALSRNEVQSVETSIIKNQRKQIQELKTTVNFIQQNQEKHLNEIKQLKIQRKSLLEKLMLMNTKEAYLLEGQYNLKEVQRLKDQRLRFIKEIETFKNQQQKLNRQIKKIELQKTKIISEHQTQLNTERNNFLTEKNHFNNEIYSLKEEIKRMKNTLIADESDRQALHQKIRSLEQEFYAKTKQLETLKLQNSRYSYKGSEPGCWQGFYGANIQFRRQKQAEERQRQRQRQRQKQKENQNINLARKSKQHSKEIQKIQKVVNQLQKQNEKLKNKLNQANQKILQLIRDKLRNGKNISPQRDRTKSSIDRPIGVFLEYQDCGFKPLIEPTLYTYHETRK